MGPLSAYTRADTVRIAAHMDLWQVEDLLANNHQVRLATTLVHELPFMITFATPG